MLVVLDAGHGGKDSGAVGGNYYEKNIAFDVTRRIRPKLEAAGIDVILTRNDDTFIELAARAELANRNNADVFVSIHLNSASTPSANGTEVWTYPGEAKDERLGQCILDPLVAATGFRNRGIKYEKFAVLRLTKMPAALVELGFITNPEQEQVMASWSYQETASTAIADGIKTYLGVNNVEQQPHWGQQYLDNLVRKGYIISPQEWENFDAPPTNAMVLALADKITDRI
mgnify:CR=1 FL=1